MKTHVERSLLSTREVSALRDSLESLKSLGLFHRIPQGAYQAGQSAVAQCLNLERIVERISLILRQLQPRVDLRLEKIWHVETTSDNSAPGRLPYSLHFDKARYLKAMIYLKNVGEGDGAMYVGTTSPEAFEIRRHKLPSDYKDRRLNEVKLEEAGSLTELLGSAGDCIFFDTNIPHKAGIPRGGHRREVLRFDFVHPNDAGIFKKALSRLTSLP